MKNLIGLILIGILIMCIPSKLNAQTQEKQIPIYLTPSQINTVLRGLLKLPMEESGNVYFSVSNQADALLKQPTPKIDSTGLKPKTIKK